MLLLCCLLSCQQDNPADPSPTCDEPATTFKYKLDGVLVDMSGSLTNNSRQGAIIRRTKDYRRLPTGCSTFYPDQDPNCQKYIYVLSATIDNLWDDEWNTAVRIRFPNIIQGQSYSKASFDNEWAYFRLPVGADGGYGTSTLSVTITKLQNG